jgi:hypothetical protein
MGNFGSDAAWGKMCNFTQTIKHNFKAPIFVYYKLTNFYANHRKFVQSRSEPQLMGSEGDVKDCDPIQENPDHQKLLPCGLIAYSFFNDKIKAVVTRRDSSDTIDLCPPSNCSKSSTEGGQWSDNSWHFEGLWEQKDIAWASDRDKKFAKTELKSGISNVGKLQGWQGVTLPSTRDEDLMVWMRTPALPHFTRLHRIIRDIDLNKGDAITFTVQNFFEVSDFHGSKSIVISSASALGGANDGLGIGLLVIGSLSFAAFLSLGLTVVKQNTVSPYR